MALPTDPKSFHFKSIVALTCVFAIFIIYLFISADANRTASPAVTMEGSEAFEACRSQIESKMSRPETIDFNLLDTTMSDDGTNARFSITGTSENAFGTAIKFTAFCFFQSGSLSSVEVTEG